MSVLNPRNRLVNFRVSEDEFQTLKAACTQNGARSISEFARSSVLRSLSSSAVREELSLGCLTELSEKFGSLETRVEQILQLLLSTVADPASEPVNGAGHMADAKVAQ